MKTMTETAAAAAAATINQQELSTYLRPCEHYGFTPLHFACDDADICKIRLLVQSCPEALEIKSFLGFTPLDLVLKRIGFDLEDLSLAQLVGVLIQKYPGDTLRLKAGYTNCRFQSRTSRALASSTNIRVMDLSRVQLDGSGLISFFHAVATTNDVLKDLTLNFFEDVNAQTCSALTKMIATNTTMTHLTLRVRLFDAETAAMVQAAIERGLEENTTLLDLHLEIVPQYKLYLLMGRSDEEALYEIDRGTIDMRIALNLAGVTIHPQTTKQEFVDMLNNASSNSSAQYHILHMAPHIWTNQDC